jgi:hypothetical protein
MPDGGAEAVQLCCATNHHGMLRQDQKSHSCALITLIAFAVFERGRETVVAYYVSCRIIYYGVRQLVAEEYTPKRIPNYTRAHLVGS